MGVESKSQSFNMGKNKNKKKNPSAGPNKSENEPKVMELSSDEEEEVKPKVTEIKEKAAKDLKKQQQTQAKEKEDSNDVEEKIEKKLKKPKPEANKIEEKEETEASTGKSASTESSQNASKENSKKADSAPVAEEPEKLPTGDCAVCGKLAKSFCSICKHVFYCTRECQRKHWNEHKEDCKALKKLPYRIERNDQLGRFLVAQTDLAAGQLIFNELPMIVGPRQLTKPLCLGCHKELKDSKSTVNCSRCGWPLCSRKCEDSPIHAAECRILRAGGQKVKVEHFGQVNMMYSCITVLRALALREGSQKIWKEYTQFESHLEERMPTPIYSKVNKEKVVWGIHHHLKLLSHYSDLEILEACGKLDTNCFEIRINGPDGEPRNLRAMYRLASIMSHECSPNTKRTFDPDYGVNIYATVPIAKGSVISVSYTQSLWSTMNRRQHLKMSKCFWCQCSRCKDPTEFGTHLSDLNCSKCGGKVRSTSPLDQNAPYRCDKCSETLTSRQVRDGHDRLTNELKSIEKTDIANLDNFLKKYATIIPDTHQLSREIQYSMVLLMKSKSQSLPTQVLLKKTVICSQLLELADKIEPGMTKWRGQILFELQSASVILAQRAIDEGRLEKYKAQEIFEENLHRLREAVAILQVEPDGKTELQEEMERLSKLLQETCEEE